MPRKLDFSKVADISLEDTQETSDVQSIVNNLISVKGNQEQQFIDNKINTNNQTHALSHALTTTSEHALSQVLTSTQPLPMVEEHTEHTSTFESNYLNNEFKEVKVLSETTVKDMAKWHTEAEQKVYKAMISEAKKEGTLELYFSFQQLSRRTGFQNRRTIIAAISGLLAKHSISILVDQHGDHHGRCYRIFLPIEIIEKRKQFQIQIHPQTKKILQANVNQ